MLTDLDLMRLQVGTLYRLDSQDRLLVVNEPDPPPAASRLFLGRTLTGDLWRFRHDLPHPLVAALDALLSAEPTATDLREPPHCFAALQAALARHGPPPETSFGPAYRFPDVIAPPHIAVVRVTPAHDAIVRRVFPILADDLPHRQPSFAILRDGHLASICYSARNTPHAAEAGVDTIEAFRGRGYAAAVVSAWASEVRAEDRIPLYSTSWENTASQAVAKKLVLVMYGADLTIE